MVSIELIDTSIKLEHLRSIDAPSLIAFHARLLKNPIASTVLRNVVYDYLRLFPCRYLHATAAYGEARI